MAVTVVVQHVSRHAGAPSRAQLARWVTAAAPDARGEVTVRITDADESRALNRDWRGRDHATNVLSFPAGELPADIPDAPFGDLVLCADVIAREAREQGKDETAHWAHMVVHGVLHLLGHDHQSAAEADTMEALEVRVLASLGWSDPYALLPATDTPVQRTAS